MAISRERLAQVGELPARCECGWDNDGTLTIVDRYATDFPPIPKIEIIEFYGQPGGDPDDRITECPACGDWLDIDYTEEKIAWKRPSPA